MAEKGTKTTYAVVGVSGNTGREVAEQLLASGKKVRVIGRNADHLKAVADMGAEPFIASIDDESALTEAFSSVQAVYSMTPLDMAVEDPLSHLNRIGEAIADARVPYVVNLSSMAATSDGRGFTSGLYNQKQRLNRLPDSVNVVHLRPPFFIENFLASINAIKRTGVIAYPTKPDISFPMIAAQDIASEAVRLLLRLDFHGKSARALLGQMDVSMAEAAKIIGRAINRDVAYVQAPYEEHTKNPVRAGMSLSVASTLTEMSRRINEGTGILVEKWSKENTTPTSIEQFAQKFAVVYNNN